MQLFFDRNNSLTARGRAEIVALGQTSRSVVAKSQGWPCTNPEHFHPGWKCSGSSFIEQFRQPETVPTLALSFQWPACPRSSSKNTTDFGGGTLPKLVVELDLWLRVRELGNVAHDL